MNFRKTVLALSVLGAVGMSGCGGSSHKHPMFTELEGVVIDDKLASADVCTDANRDAKCDASDDSAVSDSLGAFTFLTRSPFASLLALGVVGQTSVVGTGAPIAKPIVMRAPPASSTITPLSTLLTVEYERELATSASVTAAFAAAQQTVATALNIPSGITIDFANYDYEAIASSANASTESVEFAQKSVILAELVVRTINETHAVVDASSGGTAGNTIDLETLDRNEFDAAVAAVLRIPTGSTETTLDQLVDVVEDAITIAEANGGTADDVEFDAAGALNIEVEGATVVDAGTLDAGAVDGGVGTIPSTDDVEVIDEDQAEDILDEVEDINSGGTGDTSTGGTGGTGAI